MKNTEPKGFHSKTIFALFICFSLMQAGCVQQEPEADKKDWKPLFNGKDLEGWDIKIAGHEVNDNYKNTFKAEDGMLRISYDEYENFDDKYGHMYYKTPYSHYILRFKYRFTGNQTPGGAEWNVRNSGIMYHSQSAAEQTLGQEFPASLEVQLLGGLGTGERPTGNLCTPGTVVYQNGELNPAHCINSASETYEGDRWVSAQIIVLGDSVVHHEVEGDTVLTFENPQLGEEPGTSLKEGYIAVQAESHAIDFRDIEILNLKGCTTPGSKNYKSYYLVSDKGDCQ